jgi:hypothetical protein
MRVCVVMVAWLQHDTLLADLRAHLSRYPQGDASDHLIERFSERVQTQQEQMNFRAMLRQLADFINKKWVLKTQYQ